MPNRSDQRLTEHPPGLPEPSYARQVLTTIAAELERMANRRTLLDPVQLRRAYVVSVAAVVGRRNLPDAVANEVSQRVAERLPDQAADDTHGTYAQRLRQLTEAV